MVRRSLLDSWLADQVLTGLEGTVMGITPKSFFDGLEVVWGCFVAGLMGLCPDLFLSKQHNYEGVR